jgi:DNA-binding MarR family transcriptional regulator
MPGVGRKNANVSSSNVDFGILSDLIGFNLRMAQNTVHRHFKESTVKLRLGQRQFAVLELINSNPGISQVDLAAVLGVDRPAMMIVVDRLENRKLVVRKRSESDRRRQELHLTPKGSKFLDQIKIVVREHDKWFSSLFKKRDAEQLIACLQRIANTRKTAQRVP